MTHIEESLMVLVDAAGPIWETEAIRLAIREVLAERDRLDRHMKAMAAIADREKDRAEKAEAECERLRKDAARLDHIEKHARCDPKMDGHHVWWPTTFNNALRGYNLRAAIDAAMKDQPRYDAKKHADAYPGY